MARPVRGSPFSKSWSAFALTLWAVPAFSAPGELCEPRAEVLRELEQASSGGEEQGPAEQMIESLRGLRDRFPDDLFVHLRYQDAVQQRGVEGHLKEMFEEYLVLRTEHPDDPLYLYLFGRALEGRTTSQAISTMEEVLKLEPGFVPAHRTLAEIYGSARFRDRDKEKMARTQFQQACPGSSIQKQPPPLPPRGDFSTAEQLLGKNEAKDRVVELVYQALQQDEWRLQRIRPFDWYTAEEKKQVGLEVQSAQWKAWDLLLRHYRALGEDSKADQLFSEIQDRFQRVRGNRNPDLFWMAATALVQLYAKDGQPDKVRDIFAQMEKFLAATPNRKRSAELARLKSSLAARSTPRALKQPRP
jgi:pentatricopeptide repeat protein